VEPVGRTRFRAPSAICFAIDLSMKPPVLDERPTDLYRSGDVIGIEESVGAGYRNRTRLTHISDLVVARTFWQQGSILNTLRLRERLLTFAQFCCLPPTSWRHVGHVGWAQWGLVTRGREHGRRHRNRDADSGKRSRHESVQRVMIGSLVYLAAATG
jgi:hypothetical protein